jgi:hypothetical protein
MSDLISRQAAIDAIKDMYKAAEIWGEGASDDIIKARAESCMASLVEMKLRIEKLPPAQPDAVEVVRCRDCMHRNGSACDYSAVWVRKNGYCQWGERKLDEDPSHPWADSVMMGD